MGRFSTLVRFLIAFSLLVLLILIGTLGYALIEDWSIGDSLYMTFITISTVGFGEVKPLSAAGQHFTIVFLVLSIGTVGYSATVLITYVFEGQILHVMRERRMKRAIRHLKNHFIIVGGGDVGREAAYEFSRSKKRFVVVDRNPSQSDLSKDESVLFLEAVYTIQDDYHLEVRYNVYNYDDYILLDRYYTANVVRINIGYDLHLE